MNSLDRRLLAASAALAATGLAALGATAVVADDDGSPVALDSPPAVEAPTTAAPPPAAPPATQVDRADTTLAPVVAADPVVETTLAPSTTTTSVAVQAGADEPTVSIDETTSPPTADDPPIAARCGEVDVVATLLAPADLTFVPPVDLDARFCALGITSRLQVIGVYTNESDDVDAALCALADSIDEAGDDVRLRLLEPVTCPDDAIQGGEPITGSDDPTIGEDDQP